MRFLCIDNKNDEHLTVGKIYNVFHSTNIPQSVISNSDLYSIKTPYYVGDDGFSYVFIPSIQLGKTFVKLDEIRDKKIIDLLNE